jgi:hypothetical protein
VNFVIEKLHYQNVVVIGYSLGGNITLKYAGEKGNFILPNLKAVVAISAPCNLKDTSIQLSHWSNFIYLMRFIHSMKNKALYKAKVHKHVKVNVNDLKRAKNFFDIDNLYTAPAHGFRDAEEYWEKCSCKQFIPEIKIPALLINALDDPFLAVSCFPYIEAEENPNFFLETPKYGGHVGFSTGLDFKGPFWHEMRTINFLKNYL